MATRVECGDSSPPVEAPFVGNRQLADELARLRAENLRLKREIEQLRRMLGIDVSQPSEQTNFGSSGITHDSPKEAKLGLFKSRFVGRDDVFALRFESPSRQGYRPACLNEFDTLLCSKSKRYAGPKRFRCAECPNKAFRPLDDEALIKHFKRGCPPDDHVVGIYVTREDGSCRVAAVDFDDGDFFAAANAVRRVCEMHEIPAAVERSRSGSGAHVWLFFSEPVSAKLARSLAFALISAAMRIEPGISFKSYDRVFPTQDSTSELGLGNLVALPFQGAAMPRGNSVFVDVEGRPYADQWAYLDSVGTMD